MGSWMKMPGEAGIEELKKSAVTGKQLWRFWLKAGEKKKVLFVKDERAGVLEHGVKIGNLYEKFTCSTGSDCYFCAKKVRSQWVEYSTVLDLTPFTAKDGTRKEYARRALGASGAAIDILNRRRQDKGGDLTGYIVECFRDGDKSPSIGNDFTVGDKKDVTKLDPKTCGPIDFREFLAPLPHRIIEAQMNEASPDISLMKRADLLASKELSEDIPF